MLDESDDTKAVRALNERVAAGSRVKCIHVPIREGVLLVRKI